MHSPGLSHGLAVVSWYRDEGPSRTSIPGDHSAGQTAFWNLLSHGGPSTSCSYETICTQLGQHQMTIRFMDNSAAAGRREAFMYQVSCPAVQAGAAQEHPGSTLCTKDLMSVSREAEGFSHRPCRGVWCLDRVGLRNKVRLRSCLHYLLALWL